MKAQSYSIDAHHDQTSLVLTRKANIPYLSALCTFTDQCLYVNKSLNLNLFIK